MAGSNLAKSLIFRGLDDKLAVLVSGGGNPESRLRNSRNRAASRRRILVATASRTKRNPVKPAQIAKAIDEGRESLDLYLDEISRVPLLSRAEEMELARHKVRFVVSVAKKFQNRGVPLVDLIGEGNLGLMTAARKFDPDRGVKFISYAVWWIRQAVQAAI